MPKRLLVTGSSGFIGAEVGRHFAADGFEIHGLDNRPPGQTTPGFTHHDIDVRDRDRVIEAVREIKPYGVVHAAALVSVERAQEAPAAAFDINTTGTFNILEGTRRFAPDSPFIFLSSSQVYGDRPNTIALTETDTRFDIAPAGYLSGIGEDFPSDQSTHHALGASKLAADLLVQEYGRQFHLSTLCLRASSIAGTPEGFLRQMVRCHAENREFTIHGHQGKQVRDLLHVTDLVRFIHLFYDYPRVAFVTNLGGGPENACSILEAAQWIEKISGRPVRMAPSEKSRIGDPICYYSDLRPARKAFPTWRVTRSLEQIITELLTSAKTNPDS